MIRERPNLVSDGTVEGTYWTMLCPECVERARAEATEPPTAEVVLVPGADAPPLLDWQKFLIERKSRKG